MYGPGRYVPDPTEGIPTVKDLPAPPLVAYHRDHTQTAGPRCSQLASRHTSGQRLWHDVGDWCTGHPLDLLVTSASPSCDRCTKHCTIALSAGAPPGAHDTHRVIDVAGRVVSDDGRPSRPANGPLWRAHRVLVPCATIQHGGEAGGKKGARAHGRRGSRVGPCGIVGLCCRRRTLCRARLCPVG